MSVSAEVNAILHGAGNQHAPGHRVIQVPVRHQPNMIMYLTFSLNDRRRGPLTRQILEDFFKSEFGNRVVQRVELNSSPYPKHGWLFLSRAEYAQLVLGPKPAPRKFHVPPHGHSVWVKPHRPQSPPAP